jgi:hypoxanthine-guanine phosphoribosyltransferase
MQPNARAFMVSPHSYSNIVGSRILLLDDIYVSGSRAQSAAAVLRRAGARSVLIVPLGRVVRPDRFVTHAAFVDAHHTDNGHRTRCVVVQTGAGRR